MSDTRGVSVVRRPDGVAVILFDTPASRLNILSSRFFDAFREALESVLADSSIKACVLASAKEDNFIAGADFKEFLQISEPAAAAAISQTSHVLLDLIARSPKPFVAAIHGPALGGGFETALACHYRLASDSPKTVVGLPEVMLGLLPGGGGCQRLPRLIGLPKALGLLLNGDRVHAKKARKLGLVDALTSPGGIVESAASAALRLAAGTLRPRRDLPRLDGLLTYSPLRAIALRAAREQVMRKTRGLYAAPLEILACVRRGLARGISAGYEAESQAFGRLVASEATKHLIRLFMAMNDKKVPGSADPRPVRRLGVIGAGFMGEGIAAVSMGQVPIAMRDISKDMLAKCARELAAGLEKRVQRGVMTRLERDRQWSRLHFTTEIQDLATCDLVIEAVFEKLDVKQRVLADVEATIAPDAVYASNTSALPIAQIAAKAAYPERILGMHYFSPVPKMPLLEIVVTERTAPWAIATARQFGVAQGKTCIVVHDGPGFYTSRILSPYIAEALVLLTEGAAIEALDAALLDFGFPVGPIALLDEVGIDVGGHVARDLGQVFAYRMQGSPGAATIAKIVDAGYSGRKSGRGFYRYPPLGRMGNKRVNSDIYAFFGGPARREIPKQAMAERLSFMLINEAVYCLEEGILATPADGDIGAILGLGFPAFTGGPFRYLDAMGAAQAVSRLEALAKVHGERFVPAPALVELARRGAGFYQGSSTEAATNGAFPGRGA
ncbi:MAG: enoyl-CoA hydratase/isomerase family protein [Cyanobacteria bacterium REEB65]|nr:enoyl-CoA hydratase/isomerase family protein [Cyanobacteria bacterium REEB65]